MEICIATCGVGVDGFAIFADSGGGFVVGTIREQESGGGGQASDEVAGSHDGRGCWKGELGQFFSKSNLYACWDAGTRVVLHAGFSEWAFRGH